VAGLIPPHLLEQIRSANDIVDVVGAVVPLKRAGTNFVGLCPFHREKTPSFNVSPHRQIFHCFGCQKGGDVFTFVREYESLSFFEAVKRLAEIAFAVNEKTENIGARRLYTAMEKLLEDVSFNAEKHHGDAVVIDAAYVDKRLSDLAQSEDLARYVL